MKRLSVLSLLLAVCLVASSALGQQKPALTAADYGKWENLGLNHSSASFGMGAPVLSSDGQWLAYRISRVNGEGELRLHDLASSYSKTFDWGQDPVISENSTWIAWAIGQSEEETERLRKEEKPVRLDAGLLKLGNDGESTFSEISRFAFDETGNYLALLGYAPEEPEGVGANLRLLDLRGESEVSFGNVSEFAWAETGSLLAMTISTGRDEGNGIQHYDAASGRLQGLHSSASSYKQPSWREDGDDLAVLKSVKATSDRGSAFHVLIWRDLGQSSQRQAELSDELVPEGYQVVEHRRPEWSDDGSKLAIGLRPVPPSEKDEESEMAEEGEKDEKKKEDEPELPTLQVWHTADLRLYPEQKNLDSRDKQRTLLAIWHIDPDRLALIGSKLMERASMLESWEHGIERISEPYPWGAKFGRPYHDLWSIDAYTGARQKILEKVRYSWDSATGEHLLTFDGKHYWAIDVQSGARTNLTERIDTGFADLEYDTPTDLLPPYGVGGWLKGDSAVLLYDRYDVWQLAPDGSKATRITRGAEDQVVHRLVDLDREETAYDPDQLYFSLHGDKSEKRGYARLVAGQSEPARLIFEDKFVRGLMKAKESDTFVYRSEARDDSPDYFTAGPDLATPKQVSNTNPFQSDYAWTRSELVNFTSEKGVDLQAALLYPVNHDPSRRYPMIVYTYELLAPQIHLYESPSERDYYNFTAWTQQGYFVLMPDIVYEARDPGVSAVASVRAAVKSIVDRGLVDEARVGLIGHSWGGYQATYLPTRTKIFAASVAGAPLTDFVSFMGQIHWGPGIAEVSHWETGQGRMEVPFWEDPEAHRRNSPIHKVHEMDTPLLMAFGNEDGVVDWDQGTEFFNFARRAEKQMVLLVYEGEDHGFRNEANQKDYHRRILEWFGHYLKGEEAPEWITQGIAYQDLEDEKKRVAKDQESQ